MMSIAGRLARLVAVAATLVLLGAAPGRAQLVLREAHFDAADDHITTPNEHYRLLSENGATFHMPFQQQASSPWFSISVAMDGKRSLGLRIGPSAPGQTANDRSEFTIVHQDDKASLHLGEDRYLGFAIFFNRTDFPPPRAEIIVCQVWQAYRPGAATGPPAFIVMRPNATNLAFRLATRDDRNTASVQVPLAHATFLRGVWNAVVLHVLPRAVGDPAGPGLIEMWLNGAYLGGVRRSWGYVTRNAVDRFDVRVGLYANPQPVAHTIWIDRVRWGLTRQAVDPGLAPVKPPTAPTPLSR
jgi:hypothetical protein